MGSNSLIDERLNDPTLRQLIANSIESEYYQIFESMRERSFRFADIAINAIKEGKL